MPDPDFVIDIGGSDITGDVTSWKLHHTDDGISSITTVIANHNHIYSGRFNIDDEFTLIFGNSEHIGDKIEMVIRGVDEFYKLGEPTVSLTAKDYACELKEKNIKGHAKEGINPKEASQKIGKEGGAKGEKLDIDTGRGQDPPLPKYHKLSFQGEDLGSALMLLGSYLYFPESFDTKDA